MAPSADATLTSADAAFAALALMQGGADDSSTAKKRVFASI